MKTGNNLKIRPYFDKEIPETFENLLILRYKLKIKINFKFKYGHDFCILLDFSEHLLLLIQRQLFSKCSGLSQQLTVCVNFVANWDSYW